MAIEFPEALIIARQMHVELQGKCIAHALLSEACDSLIRQGFINLNPADIAGKTIESVASQGKWVFVKLDSSLYLLFALETGGTLLYHSSAASAPEKYHVMLGFNDGTSLTERIVGWGWAKVHTETELEHQRYPGKPGLSALDETFTFDVFNRLLEADSKKALKLVLLDQQKVAGIGNGYLQDILFKAGLHPKRKAASLIEGERQRLHKAIIEILREAIRLGGRITERDLYNNPGSYVSPVREAGKPCPVCGTPIEKLAVFGTTSYVCPNCQKI